MKKKQNPVCYKGYRNIFCPFYTKCLDHAVIQRWEYWSCQECKYMKVQEVLECDRISPDNADPYHCVSPTIYKKTGNFSV